MKPLPAFLALSTALAGLSLSAAPASARPATLDTKNALAANTITMANFSGQVYKLTKTEMVPLKAYQEAAKGKKDRLRDLLPAAGRMFSFDGVSVKRERDGFDFDVSISKKCRYQLRLNDFKWTNEGIIATYGPRGSLPKACPATAPAAATGLTATVALVIKSASGNYLLPTAPNGAVVAVDVPELAPSVPQDAGLYGYTFFVRHVSGDHQSWGTAGILGNKQAARPSPKTAMALVREAALQGGPILKNLGISPVMGDRGGLAMNVREGAHCQYQMLVDKSSIRRQKGLLAYDFIAPKFTDAQNAGCRTHDAVTSLTISIEPLGAAADGTNVFSPPAPIIGG